VPRVWACALAALLGVDVPAELPDAWRLLAAEAAARSGVTGEAAVIPRGTFEEPQAVEPAPYGGDPLGETERTIMRLRASHPLLRDAG
jgi:hypothetical protein